MWAEEWREVTRDAVIRYGINRERNARRKTKMMKSKNELKSSDKSLKVVI